MIRMLMDSMKAVLREELTRVKRQHGDAFNSLHEAYGVLQEEVEEITEEAGHVLIHQKLFWKAARNDDPQAAIDAAKGIRKYAITLACEAIQVAAVATKAITTANRMKGGSKR